MIIPRSQFGPVPIAILQDPVEPADWKPDINLQAFHFPGGNVSEIQNLGMGLFEAPQLIQLADEDAFASFLPLLGTEQTLRMPRYGVSAYRGDHETTLHGEEVKYFYRVTLWSIDGVLPRFDGAVRCQCVFKRSPS